MLLLFRISTIFIRFIYWPGKIALNIVGVRTDGFGQMIPRKSVHSEAFL